MTTFARSSGRPGRVAAAILGAALIAGLLPGVATAATAPTITSAAGTTFTVGVAGTFTVTTTGVPVPSVTQTGALPSGVSFVDNGDGTATLSGTPASGTNGSYPLSITAANGTLPNAVQSFTLTVALGTVPTITSANSTTFTVGVAGTFSVTTTGLPTPTIARGGVALPSGVTFTDNGNGTGTLAGTPASGTSGSYVITFTATNANGSSAVQSFTLTVALGTVPTITSAASTTFTVGVAGTFTVTTTGLPTPTIARGGAALPSGVTYTDNGNGTGTLAGTPASGTNGSYAITFTATNSNGSSAVQSFTLTVALGTVPTITSANSTTFTVGVAGTFTVTTTGLPTPTITRGGAALPSGVTFTDNGNGTGTLAGTPASGTNGSYALTFTATNANGSSAVQSFTLTVGTGSAPLITSAASTTFTIGVAGSFTVTTTGVPTPTITRGGVALPSGVTFTNNGNGTGTLSGTPASGTSGTYALTFTAANGTLPNATQNFSLIVTAAGPTVTINQASGQADPTSASPINYTVVFSAAVTGFATGDVTISGTAGGTKVGTVTGSGTTYTVAVTGMTTGGTVVATIAAGVATATSGGLPNQASTSSDNTVTWVPVTAAITLTNSASVITWGTGIVLSVQFGTGGGNRSFILEGARDGVTWTTIANLTTNGGGHASLSYRPVSNLYYRARFLGATDLGAATSNTTRTVVRQIAVLRPTNLGLIKTIARNTSITFTTTVRPARPDLPAAKVTFVLYRRISGVWTRVATRNLFINSLGKASTTFKFTSAGSWYVRSIANPTTYNANSVWSPVERYSVR